MANVWISVPQELSSGLSKMIVSEDKIRYTQSCYKLFLIPLYILYYLNSESSILTINSNYILSDPCFRRLVGYEIMTAPVY